MKQYRAPVISCQEIFTQTYLIRLDCPEIAAAAAPGQFVMVRCESRGAFLPRPLSIHRVEGGRLALLFRVAGKGTAWLAQRRQGEPVEIFGPQGNGFRIPAKARNLLLVAGGIGIAPLVFLADSAADQGKKTTIILGAASADCLMPIASLPAPEGRSPFCALSVINATEDGSEGFKGLATELIPAYLSPDDVVFACGPAAMYRAMARMPELRGIPVQVSLETVMGCGTGVCYGCTIRTKQGLRQVCQDGPVFDLGDIIWEELPEV